MRKLTLFSAVLSLFLLVPASITWAQKITQQKGLTTAVFTTPQGNIKVYLPDDIRQGDVISGRVVAEPEGTNEKQRAKNLAKLVEYSIGLNGEKFTVGNAAKTIQFAVTAGRPMQNSLELLNANGTSPIQQISIPAKPISEQKPAPAQCIIPGHVLTGSPMTILGPFDGNAANTQCMIGNQPATVLAESPRSSIITFPANANGMQTTLVQENGQQLCSKNVSGVDMNVSAGKLNLTKGENTYIDVSITGLQNLQAPALLLLNNLTTDVVALQPSNNITVPLVPDSVSSGNYNRRFNVQSIRTGGFAVNVDLDFQEIILTPLPEDTINGKKPPPVVGDKPEKPPVPEIDIPKNTDTIPELKGKLCVRAISEEKIPAMGGGLVVAEKKWSIKRDDFVPLIAEGADFDILKITCTPLNKECEEAASEIEVPLSGRVRFEWEIIGGKAKGQFVKLGCSYDKVEDGQTTNGEQVIFMPPYVPLPVLPEEETSVTTKIELRILDDRALLNEEDRKDANVKLKDDDIIREFKIITRRRSVKPEEYEIEIIYTDDKNKPVDNKMPEAPPKPDKKPPKCEATAGKWIKHTDLEKPTIILPNVPDNKKMVPGQLIVLQAKDLRETDILPGINCNTTCSQILATTATSEDNVQWLWEVTGHGTEKGKFPAGNTGRYVIYQLPEKMDKGKTEMEFSIKVKVFNPDGTQVKDANPKNENLTYMWSEGVTIKVYQPGVKLSTAYGDWVPTYNVKEGVPVTSTLMIKEGIEWKPAPAHTCRIHYFDLFDVSTEMGVCMNSPLPAEANFCRDLKIKNEKKHEAYDTVLQIGCTDIASYFMQARTQKPEHSYTITIYSEDFGSWGSLRSFANVNEESKIKEEQKPYNLFVKRPGMSAEELKDYKNGLVEYTTKLKKYYDLKETKRNLELPYYTSIPITASDIKHPYKPSEDKTPKTKKPQVPTPERAIYTKIDNRVSIPLDLDQNHIPDNGWVYLTETKGNTTMNYMAPDYSRDVRIDWDSEPEGDKWPGDGLTQYEEYRGFMVIKPGLEHRRTNPSKKDLFVDNKDNLPLGEFMNITKITVHEISENQYGSISEVEFTALKNIVNNHRFINFNSGMGHVTAQKGLYLRNEIIVNDVVGEKILGLTPSEKDLKQKKVYPAPPNWNLAVRIDRAKISRFYNGAAFDAKLAQIVAHELCHSVNVAHHGEKGQDPGLFSGDINCIMRYEVLKQAPGTTLCTQQVGAHKGRGSCALQIRVSGRVDPANITRGYPQKD